MSHQPSSERPEQDSLRVQLAELNSRSRAYTSQIWQLPLAYLAAAGVVLADLKETALTIGFFGASVLGALAAYHLLGVEEGRSRAVADLERTEKALGLEPTAQNRPEYTWPLIIATMGAAAAFLIAGFVRVCSD